MSYAVYKHTSPSGKVYIGITHQKPCYRWGKDGNGYKTQNLFYRAIQKYGWDNFDHEILFTGLNKEEACTKEKELISFFKSNNPQFGYNITEGGEHYVFTEEIKRKISEANKGRKHTDEWKRMISEKLRGRPSPTAGKIPWNKGHVYSEEMRQKFSECHKGQRAWNKGIPMTDESKLNLREKNLGSNSPKAKTVLQYDLNGSFIKEWKAVSEASRTLGINLNGIAMCARGERNHAGGYIWEYLK